LKYPQIVKAKSGLAEITQRAPALDRAFRENYSLLLTESLIRAVQARLSPLDERSRLSAVQSAVEEGYLLTSYFYEALEEFVNQPVGMRLYFPEMLDGISVEKERARLSEVQFQSAPSRPLLEARWSPLQQMLRQAQEHLARSEYEEARKVYESVSTQYGPQAEVLYGLALIASQQKQPEQAKQYFTQAAAHSYDPRIKAWSHIYLGRLLDLEGKRDEAKLQYSAALSVGQLTADTQKAAEQGLQTQFTAPREDASAPSEPPSPPRERVPMQRPPAEGTPE
jgi:tetratricopeptide (TPR) repeat protein